MKYLKEIIILILQLLLFYIFPLFCGPTDIMGMVLLMLLGTLTLSLILVVISKNKIRYLYPVGVSILFIPSVFIYYNESALVHSLWYLVVASIGLVIGILVNFIRSKIWK